MGTQVWARISRRSLAQKARLTRWTRLRSVTAALLVGAIVCAGAAAPAYCQSNCDSVGNDSINDAEIQNLQQMADNAEMRASSARNPFQQQQWENTAQTFRNQAQALRAQSDATAAAARQLCNSLTNNEGSN